MNFNFNIGVPKLCLYYPYKATMLFSLLKYTFIYLGIC